MVADLLVGTMSLGGPMGFQTEPRRVGVVRHIVAASTFEPMPVEQLHRSHFVIWLIE